MNLLEKLAIETGLREPDLRRIMLTAPVRYKDFVIPKKKGGFRSISQPAREVKLVQRAIVEVLLSGLPVHAAATAYMPESSTKRNASKHAGIGPILKMDFSDFFPSIKADDWGRYCRVTGCLSSDEDIFLTSRLLFRRQPHHSNLVLAIGAPSSPVLSNLLMYTFDITVAETVAKDKVQYTRYADDLTFSAPRLGHLREVERTVRTTLRELIYPSLKINEQKTVYATSKFGRRVTGLTLANDGRITIGRNKKRELFVAVHYALVGKLSPSQIQSLSGMLAYVNAVEPDFIDVLRSRYGSGIMDRLQHAVFTHKVVE